MFARSFLRRCLTATERSGNPIGTAMTFTVLVKMGNQGPRPTRPRGLGTVSESGKLTLRRVEIRVPKVPNPLLESKSQDLG